METHKADSSSRFEPPKGDVKKKKGQSDKPEIGKLFKLKLGEKVTLTATPGGGQGSAIKAGEPGQWQSSSNALIIDSEDLTGDSVEVLGAAIGRGVVNYRQLQPPTPELVGAASLFHPGSEQRVALDHSFGVGYEIEVVEDPDADPAETAAVHPFDGLIPVTESQEEPSEKTPYGMGLNDKPVAPYPGMVDPRDYSSVARQSEDAVAKSQEQDLAKLKEQTAKGEKKDDK
jgi:hypothetical protein